MTPSDKSPEIEKFLTKTFGVDRRTTIEKNLCTSCGEEANWFRDKLSEKEYSISGFCQKCQDKTFGPPEPMEPPEDTPQNEIPPMSKQDSYWD